MYDAPRNLLHVLSNTVVELGRNRESSFCCGAGGAQFWKEEEAGTERISDNRYREAVETLRGAEEKVLAVGCPFCKSMLESTPGRGESEIAVRDVAELLLDGVKRRLGESAEIQGAAVLVDAASAEQGKRQEAAVVEERYAADGHVAAAAAVDGIKDAPAVIVERKKWAGKKTAPKTADGADPVVESVASTPGEGIAAEAGVESQAPARKVWKPKSSGTSPG